MLAQQMKTSEYQKAASLDVSAGLFPLIMETLFFLL